MKPLYRYSIIIILLYPFFYSFDFISETLGYSFSNYYFSIPLFFFVHSLLSSHNNSLIKDDKLFGFFIFILIICVCLTNSIHYLKPLVFLVYFLSIYLLRSSIQFEQNRSIELLFFYGFFILSILFLGNEHRYLTGKRFYGFQNSPTVFSVFAIAFFILAVFTVHNKWTKVLLYISCCILVFMSKTRSSLIFIFLLPILIFLENKIRVSRKFIFIFFVILLNFAYPIYESIKEKNPQGYSLINDRIGKGSDPSLESRKSFSKIIFDDYFSSISLSKVLFGRGSEMSRQLIQEKVKEDVFPHNDFLRISYDFGLVFTVSFLIILFQISRSTIISFILGLLYLLSFYHNMIYDFFLVSLITYYSYINKEVKTEGIKKIVIGGIPIHRFTVKSLHEIIEKSIETQKKITILHSNAHLVNLANTEAPWLKGYFNNEVDYVMCDGAGIQLGAILTGQTIPPKITYNVWFYEFAEFCSKMNYSIFLLGAREGVAKNAAQNLKKYNPNLRIFQHHGYFSKTNSDNDKIIDLINSSNINVLVVCFGMPIQEKYIRDNFHKIKANIFMSGGGALDFFSGDSKTAPYVFKILSLEWLYRLILEPRRLWRRYLIGNFKFIFFTLLRFNVK